MRLKTILTFNITLCNCFLFSQTVSIRGTVTDSEGKYIAGASVSLEQADISTTTAPDGSFTLSGTVSAISPQRKHIGSTIERINIISNTLTFHLKEKTQLGVTLYTLSGRHISTIATVFHPGTHHIPLVTKNTAVHLIRVTAGMDSHIFKFTPSGTATLFAYTGTPLATSPFIQSKTAARINDVILITKEGYLNYRMTATNSDTGEIVITMLPNAGDITDIDGNVYQTVKIGNQVWTVENWRSTKYNDGTEIPHVQDSIAWYNLYMVSSTTGAYCYYDNTAANKTKYGALYNWYAVNTGKLAPQGWRVSTDADWTLFEKYLKDNGYNWDGTTSGNDIAKSIATRTDWYTITWAGSIGKDLNKNNATGFSLLPGGYRYVVGSFYNQILYGSWWSATHDIAYYRYLYHNRSDLRKCTCYKQDGRSVRLVRDYN